MTKEELAERIRAASYLEGEFTLRSGRKSSFYVDKYLFETQPDILAEVGRRLAEKVDRHTTRIAGAELGGVALAAATALAAGLPFLIVRNAKKDYGTSKQFEGRLGRGDQVLLVEDIATTGGQVLEAAKTLTDAGAAVQRIVAVVDRLEGASDNITEAGFIFEALLNARDLRLPTTGQ
ncbi:MAG: orotate phosphoribosyltransferase [Phycisphaerales bacterium]|nr:orotate phosphoribosyltransferase [Phycisphaerales bacterium]